MYGVIKMSQNMKHTRKRIRFWNIMRMNAILTSIGSHLFYDVK
jgi:hypothetical protein